MRPLGIAIWLVTNNQEVLLQQKRFKKYGREIICYQPIEEWVGSERVEDRVKRLLREKFGEIFAVQHSFRLSQIKKTRFPIIGQGMATRYHFLGKVTDQQFAIISSFGKFRLVGKEDLPKIKKMSDRQKDPKEDIVLFKEDYEILLDILSS